MLYTVAEIQKVIFPIAKKYGLKAVWLFGSHARGTATEESDVDLLIDTTEAHIDSLLQLSAIYCELEEALGKKVDLVTTGALEQKAGMPSEESFRKRVWNERVTLYAAA